MAHSLGVSMTIQEMYQEMEEQLEDDVLFYDDACVVSVDVDYTTQS